MTYFVAPRRQSAASPFAGIFFALKHAFAALLEALRPQIYSSPDPNVRAGDELDRPRYYSTPGLPGDLR